jgi:hypothetical protein
MDPRTDLNGFEENKSIVPPRFERRSLQSDYVTLAILMLSRKFNNKQTHT